MQPPRLLKKHLGTVNLLSNSIVIIVDLEVEGIKTSCLILGINRSKPVI